MKQVLEPLNEEKGEGWIEHYPENGELLLDGRLRVKTSGKTDGEIWDGFIEVGPEDPRYLAWAERLRNKEQYFAAQAEAIREARRQRQEAKKRQQE